MVCKFYLELFTVILVFILQILVLSFKLIRYLNFIIKLFLCWFNFPVSWLHRGRGNFRGRGRGFGRGHVDMFRSRKQNTSRPPSMHVDDFIAMENSASPSDNQGKQPIKVCVKVVLIISLLSTAIQVWYL